MAGDFTRLFHSFFDSSIRQEKAETRLVFLAMIAKADEAGIVRATVRAISDFACIPIEETQVALERLQLPDPESTSTAEDGRRIVFVAQNVWHVVNYRHYWELSRKEERKEQVRKAVKKHREDGNQVKSDLITVINGKHSSTSTSESLFENSIGEEEGVGEEGVLDDLKKFQLPETGYKPTAKDILWAKGQANGVDEKYVEWQTGKFNTYWYGRSTRDSKKSIRGWRDAWRNWIDNSIFRYGELDAYIRHGGDQRRGGAGKNKTGPRSGSSKKFDDYD